MIDVTWYNAVRFANWLTNGQGAGSTESGTYTISGSGPNWTVAVPSAAQRAAWSDARDLHWLLPSEDEWYKAAYYETGGTNSGYWAYPTKSNVAPINILDPVGTNNANFYDRYDTGTHGYTTTNPYLTNVGAFAGSPGPYGTYDQGGDVWQWNEALIGSWRGLRGGYWFNASSYLLASDRNIGSSPASKGNGLGFRVASVGVPEPGSLALLLTGVIGLLAYGWRRRKRTA